MSWNRPYIAQCLRVGEDIIIVNGKCQVHPKQEICDGCTFNNLHERGNRNE